MTKAWGLAVWAWWCCQHFLWFTPHPFPILPPSHRNRLHASPTTLRRKSRLHEEPISSAGSSLQIFWGGLIAAPLCQRQVQQSSSALCFLQEVCVNFNILSVTLTPKQKHHPDNVLIHWSGFWLPCCFHSTSWKKERTANLICQNTLHVWIQWNSNYHSKWDLSFHNVNTIWKIHSYTGHNI